MKLLTTSDTHDFSSTFKSHTLLMPWSSVVLEISEENLDFEDSTIDKLLRRLPTA
jgi:hypothetical protein